VSDKRRPGTSATGPVRASSSLSSAATRWKSWVSHPNPVSRERPAVRMGYRISQNPTALRVSSFFLVPVVNLPGTPELFPLD